MWTIATRIYERYSVTSVEQYSKVIEQYRAWTIAQGFMKDILWHQVNDIQRLLNNIVHEQYSPRVYEQYYSEYRPTRILFIERKSNNIPNTTECV